MSKFFTQGSSDSSSESSEDEAQDVPVKKAPIARDFNFPSDSEEDEKRIVRAHKDKKFDELKDKVRNIRNAKNNRDITKLLSEFDELVKVYDKSKTVFARQNIEIPRFYVRCIVELEDFVTRIWDDKDAKNALSKVNSKALNTIRGKIRKYNAAFGPSIQNYKDNADPEGYESPEEEFVDEFDEDSKPSKPHDKKKKVHSDTESDVTTDDESWAEDSEPPSTDTEMDFDTRKMEDLRRYFLKKEFRGDEIKKEETEREKRRRLKMEENKAKTYVESDLDDEGWTEVTKEKKIELFDPKQEVTHEAMINKVEEVMASRGRLGTNRKQHVRQLQELYRIAEEKKLGAGIYVKLLFNIVSSLFELNAKISDFMEYPNFTKTLTAVSQLLDMLVANNDSLLMSIKYTEEDENLKDSTVPYKVQGSFLMTVTRLDSELTKILQNADCHSNDYIEKLKGEKDMCSLIERTEQYVEANANKNIFEVDEICKIYMMRIEHLYYKYQEHHDGTEPISDIMERLCKKIYALDEEKRLRQRAMLCHIYWLALHDEWHRARDMMLMSHLQAIVDHSDTDTQILYNRAICQLGLCAFRHGFIKEAHQGLSEIQNTQRAKELLAQAVTMRHERTAEQEKAERQRQVPYHMHVNVELMECVYLICSMLLEIPHMASCEFEMRRRLLSRSFHYQLKQSEKASLVGPPENTREHVVAASRAMLAGDWKKCRDYIVNDKMNQKVWNLFRNADHVKNMVIRRIQEESLRTYLLMYATVYTTMSLKKLSTLFELDRMQIHSVISKMIIQEELSATLDQPTDCLIMHRVEPSRLQMLALNLTDKIQMLAENNEQILEPRTGRAGFNATGAWFPGRERQGEKQKGGTGAFQSDRRTGQSQGKGSNTWGSQNERRRRGDGQKRT